MAGPAINIRLHNTKRQPAGFCQRRPEPPALARGKGRKREPPCRELPGASAPPERPANPLTHKAAAPQPTPLTGGEDPALRGASALGATALGRWGGRESFPTTPQKKLTRRPPQTRSRTGGCAGDGPGPARITRRPLAGRSQGRFPSPDFPPRSSGGLETARAEETGARAQPPGLAAILKG